MLRRSPKLAAALLAYIGLPYLLVQWLNLGVVRHGSAARRTAALTFDDGPDPATTPQVLDALRDAGAHATFFVLDGCAEAHPDLIERMQAEGHEVAVHGGRHRHAWLRTPWNMMLDPARAAARIARVTGSAPVHYRPPHGAYTLATVIGMRRAGLRGAHWTVTAYDWDDRTTPEDVQRRVLRRIDHGGVIVLHDAGPGARTTVPALPGLLAALRERGYTLMALRDLPGARVLRGPDLLRRAARALDRAYDRVSGARPITGHRDSFLRVGVSSFPLPDVTLPDGTRVPSGSPQLEFHVHNARLVDAGLRRAGTQTREALRELARALEVNPTWARADALYCLSALHPVLRGVGFETVDVPQGMERRLGAWARVLRGAYGTTRAKAPQPKLSVISLDEVRRRYGAEVNA
ncbi:polysaccharide deacetylase family protein [Deinococcus maricopensis]|uniref:Polysaccharide deacetylase n=1 Tax=Deinococcus maricopensis (strain DSM 21211 / LMG 22137 / NRRL B-23946 / LB-34) TaxID=709986 RepID=E8UBR9_DEIML|nr:polysaccharide deacetylase family protein [Deinococcus maricopensis]ADV68508.1 polysaccharide deacetylase [Deinococcus maricopensis DSM 21211]